jgi:Transposase DDE domain
MNTSMGLQEQEIEAVDGDWLEELVGSLAESLGEERPKKKSGRPQQVPWVQIVAGMLVSVFFGMKNYQQLWRRLRRKALAGFAPIRVQDDAIIKRLKQAGTAPFERLVKQVGQQPVVEGTAQDLATFAPKIVAIDEMTGDQMRRRLKEQRRLKKGDSQLLPGKLAGRYNIRAQQWEVVQWRQDVQANCKVEVMSLLVGLEAGSLLLFDLGYFAFWWFDQLSQQGYHWVSRLREKTSYELVHFFWRFEGNLDALIWLGAHRADRAGKMVRLVRFWDGEQLHSYITNVLDPRQLSIKAIAQLYARRWDIELAFLLLKQYLGLHQWWSSHPVLMQQQCLALILVAQRLQHLRMQMALQAGVDAFEVSLPLVLDVLPELVREQQEPLAWMSSLGRDLGLIRPSSRRVLVVPEVPEEHLLLPAAKLPQERPARYHSYGYELPTSQPKVTASKTATAKKREQKQEEAARNQAPGAKGPEKMAREGKEKKSRARAEQSKKTKNKQIREKESSRKQQKKLKTQLLARAGLPRFSG